MKYKKLVVSLRMGPYNKVTTVFHVENNKKIGANCLVPQHSLIPCMFRVPHFLSIIIHLSLYLRSRSIYTNNKNQMPHLHLVSHQLKLHFLGFFWLVGAITYDMFYFKLKCTWPFNSFNVCCNTILIFLLFLGLMCNIHMEYRDININTKYKLFNGWQKT